MFGRSDALDHDDGFQILDFGFINGQAFFQFLLGDDPLIAPITIFRAAIFRGPGSQDNSAMVDLLSPAIGAFDGRLKLPMKPSLLSHPAFQVNDNGYIGFHFTSQA